MPAIIKTHQRIIKIQPKPPKGPNPKFIILLSVKLLLPKGDDHPPHIIFIIGIQPPLIAGNTADVSQPALFGNHIHIIASFSIETRTDTFSNANLNRANTLAISVLNTRIWLESFCLTLPKRPSIKVLFL